MRVHHKTTLAMAIAALAAAPGAAADNGEQMRQVDILMQKIDELEQQQRELRRQVEATAARGDAAVTSKGQEEASGAGKAVQVYGQLRLSVDHNSDDFGDGSRGTGVKSNASRIGVKGVLPTTLGDTDLLYKAEIRYGAADEPDDEVEWREGYAGLKGGWGKVRLGRLSTHYKSTLTKIDPWNDNVPQSRHKGKQGSSSFHRSYFNNAIEYATPKRNGVSAAAWYSTQFDGETDQIHNAGELKNYEGGDARGVGVRYAGGPWFASAGYLDIEADNVASANMDNGSGWEAALRYKGGAWSVAGFYEDVEDLGLGTNTYLNGIYRIGHTRLIATVGRNRDATQFGEKDIDTWSAGAKYDLTRKSELFAAYNVRDEEDKEYETVTMGVNAKFGY